jgi:hypothetical protein
MSDWRKKSFFVPVQLICQMRKVCSIDFCWVGTPGSLMVQTFSLEAKSSELGLGLGVTVVLCHGTVRFAESLTLLFSLQ